MEINLCIICRINWKTDDINDIRNEKIVKNNIKQKTNIKNTFIYLTKFYL